MVGQPSVVDLIASHQQWGVALEIALEIALDIADFHLTFPLPS